MYSTISRISKPSCLSAHFCENVVYSFRKKRQRCIWRTKNYALKKGAAICLQVAIVLNRASTYASLNLTRHFAAKCGHIACLTRV